MSQTLLGVKYVTIDEFEKLYEWKKNIAEGGNGKVYKAVEKATGDTVVVKMTQDSYIYQTEKKDVIDTLDEAFLLLSLNYSGIVRVRDVYVVEMDDPDKKIKSAIIMDYVDGYSFYDIVLCSEKSGLKFSDRDIYETFLGLARIIHYLHSREKAQGVIAHMDIKPANIMVTKKGGLVLIDFGSACQFKKCDRDKAAHRGTDYYISPEILKSGKGRVSDEELLASDIWALGITIDWMMLLPNDEPYDRKGGVSWDNRVPKLPRTGNRELKNIVTRCLERNPRSRIKINELVDYLENMKVPFGDGPFLQIS